MKKFLGLLAVGILSAGLALFAQNSGSNSSPPQGTGAANCPNCPNCPNGPNANCDKDGDGLCDITGLPVGQCRQAGGQGARCGRGPGQGQGQGRGPNVAGCPRAGNAGQGPQAARR